MLNDFTSYLALNMKIFRKNVLIHDDCSVHRTVGTFAPGAKEQEVPKVIGIRIAKMVSRFNFEFGLEPVLLRQGTSFFSLFNPRSKQNVINYNLHMAKFSQVRQSVTHQKI